MPSTSGLKQYGGNESGVKIFLSQIRQFGLVETQIAGNKQTEIDLGIYYWEEDKPYFNIFTKLFDSNKISVLKLVNIFPDCRQ